MTIASSGIPQARQRLSELVAGLRDAASGAVAERAARAVQEQVAAVTKRILGQHVDSGHAQETAEATHAGNVVQLSASGYLKYHAWWPFRSGMPPFVLARATRIYKAELEAALAGKTSPLLAADEAAEEIAAARAAAKFKKDIARIYRQSDEYKAKKRAEARERREDRAIDRRIREREEREDRVRG